MAVTSTGTDKEISIPIPRVITDPLGSLLILQSLFSTSELNCKQESWKFTLMNHNLLCITTNNEGSFDLLIRNGYISFHNDENTISEKKDLSGNDISTVLVKLCKAIEKSLYCEVVTEEHGTSTNRKFRYRLEFIDGNIIRKFLDVQYHW